MKVCYITNVAVPGVEAQSFQVTAMSEAFFSVLGKDFLLISRKMKERPAVAPPFQWVRLPAPGRLPRSVRYILCFFQSLPHVVRFRPSVIMTRDIFFATAYRLLGFRVVYDMHKRFLTRIGDVLFRLIAKKLLITTVSESLQNYIASTYAIPKEKICLARNGVFLERFYAIYRVDARRQLTGRVPLLKDKKIILYSGTMSEGKGLDDITAMAERKKDVFFVIVGALHISTAGVVPSNVICLGHQEHQDVPLFLKAADVLLLPYSRSLGIWQTHSALKMFEYMASGTPIVASRLGAICEMLNESNAFLFEPESLESFEETLSYALEHTEEASQKAIQAYDDIHEFTWEKRVRRVLEYIKVSQESRSSR